MIDTEDYNQKFQLRLSIIELSECIKELVRIAQLDLENDTPRQALKDRLQLIYNKATLAKDRVDL